MMNLGEWEKKYADQMLNANLLQGTDIAWFDVLRRIEAGNFSLVVHSTYCQSAATVRIGRKDVSDHHALKNALLEILPPEFIDQLNRLDADYEIDFSVLDVEHTMPPAEVTEEDSEINEEAIAGWLNGIINDAVATAAAIHSDAWVIDPAAFLNNLAD